MTAPDPTPANCTCGYGGYHEPLNPLCQRNLPPAVPDTGDVGALVDMAAVIRQYLTDQTNATMPSFHATAIVHRLASHVARVRQDTAKQIAQAIEAHGSLYDRDADWRDGVDEAADIARQAGTR